MIAPAIVICPYCRAKAELVAGDAIYPHREDLARLPFYRCEPCKAWVGCHPGTRTPLGRLADAPLRRAKHQVHVVLDRHWKYATGRRREARTEAYARLARDLGIPSSECHVGMFDLQTCERAIAAIARWIAPARGAA